MELTRELKIETLGGGAVMEKLEIELEKVIANIKDINVDKTKSNKIGLQIEFKPNGQIVITTDVKLAPYASFDAQLVTGKDKNGEIVVAEAAMVEGDLFAPQAQITSIAGGRND